MDRRLPTQPGEELLQNGEAMFTVLEAARVIRCGKDTAYRLIRSGELGHIRVGQRKLLVPRAALMQYITRQHQGVRGD